MQGRWKYAAVALLTLLLGFYLYNRFRTPPDINMSGLSLTLLDGRQANISRFYGRPVIVNFAASWCGPCRQEIRDLQSVRGEIEETAGVLVVSDEEMPVIQALSEQTGAFEFVKLNSRFSDLGIHSIPTTYLLNRYGKVVKKHTGYIDWTDPSARAHLLKLMNK